MASETCEYILNQSTNQYEMGCGSTWPIDKEHPEHFSSCHGDDCGRKLYRLKDSNVVPQIVSDERHNLSRSMSEGDWMWIRKNQHLYPSMDFSGQLNSLPSVRPI